MNPLRMQGGLGGLSANPFPGLALRTDINASQRQVALRLMGKRRIFEGLAKKAKEQCWVAEIRKGRGRRANTQGAGSFTQRLGPIRRKPLCETHLRDLLQAFTPGFLRRAFHVGRMVLLSPSGQKTSKILTKTRTENNTLWVGGSPIRYRETQFYNVSHSSPRPVWREGAPSEFQYVACDPSSFFPGNALQGAETSRAKCAGFQ